MSRFKDKNQQAIYEVCRRLGNEPASEFYWQGKPRRGAVHRSAYWLGRAGKPQHLWPRTCLAYACYVAGKDDLKEHGFPE